VRNDEVLYTVKNRSTLPTVKRRKNHWIGHTLRNNCRIKHVSEGKIEGTRRPGRRLKQILDHAV
jgi:hypothetical protein